MSEKATVQSVHVCVSGKLGTDVIRGQMQILSSDTAQPAEGDMLCLLSLGSKQKHKGSAAAPFQLSAKHRQHTVGQFILLSETIHHV